MMKILPVRIFNKILLPRVLRLTRAKRIYLFPSRKKEALQVFPQLSPNRLLASQSVYHECMCV